MHNSTWIYTVLNYMCQSIVLFGYNKKSNICEVGEYWWILVMNIRDGSRELLNRLGASVVHPECFFGSGFNFSVSYVSRSESCFGSYVNFLNILEINSRLISVLGCILWRHICFLGKCYFDKKLICIFKFSIFVEKLSNVISF